MQHDARSLIAGMVQQARLNSSWMQIAYFGDRLHFVIVAAGIAGS
jgi:hypothetical protein